MLKARLKSEGEEILEITVESKKVTVEVEDISEALDLLPLLSDFKSSVLETLKEHGFEVSLKKSFLEMDL